MGAEPGHLGDELAAYLLAMPEADLVAEIERRREAFADQLLLRIDGVDVAATAVVFPAAKAVRDIRQLPGGAWDTGHLPVIVRGKAPPDAMTMMVRLPRNLGTVVLTCHREGEEGTRVDLAAAGQAVTMPLSHAAATKAPPGNTVATAPPGRVRASDDEGRTSATRPTTPASPKDAATAAIAKSEQADPGAAAARALPGGAASPADADDPPGHGPPQALIEVGKFLALGFWHIIPTGPDHILFVLGLFLLSPTLRPLLWQVTAFTVAHSATLALSLNGLISLSPAVVEPLIAASIGFVAIENLFTSKLKPWRPAVVFAFGLLHGLGFAGVMQELGLPRDHLAAALVGFNLGVEAGQLAVIGAAFLLVGWFRHRSWYRTAVAVPASLAIAVIGAYWVVERTLM
jgi:hypothetical protein